MKQIKSICVVIAMVLFVGLAAPQYVQADYSVDGILYKWIDSYEYYYLGTYSPGTYDIYVIRYPEASVAMLDEFRSVCDIPVISGFFNCEIFDYAEKGLEIIPKQTFQFILKDADTGEQVWKGKLKSGKDRLYLGEDHKRYDVYVKPTGINVGVAIGLK